MKKAMRAASLAAAALMTASALSGCNLLQRFLPGQQPVTEPETTAAATVETTEELTTEAPTEAPTTQKAEQSSQTKQSSTSEGPNGAPGNDPSPKQYSGVSVVSNEFYSDETIGLGFYAPEWVNKVYAKSEYVSGEYYLSFYEITNYDYGVEKGWDGMGLLFSVCTSDTESTGDWIDFPAGSLLVGGQRKYLTYFKPTDVRFDTENQTRTDNYQNVYQHQSSIFKGAVVLEGRDYIPSTNNNHIDLSYAG